MAPVVVVALLLSAVLQAHAAVPLTKETSTFGHSIKNGPLPANTEVTTFEHTCSSPPCAITQLHVPSIYPGKNPGWDWWDGLIAFYIDGETVPSINLTILELGWVGRYSVGGGKSLDNRGLPWGIDKFGHTASSGGIYSTLRIPFQKSIKSTIRAAQAATQPSIYWFIIRGMENYPVVFGDLTLPPTTKLKMYRTTDVVLHKLDFITLANISSGTAGALAGLKFDAYSSVGFTYLEACLRLIPTGAKTPFFLSSGAEDYFLSASYFDEGEFISPNSGVTYMDPNGGLSAFKMHDRDPVLFSNGAAVVWRQCEDTQGCGSFNQCPDQFCPSGSKPEQLSKESKALVAEAARTRRGAAKPAEPAKPSSSDTCTGIGPIAYGFDRPGDDHDCFTMTEPNPKPEDCAQHCCNTPECQSWVFAVTPASYLNCKKAGDLCCWLKTGSPQIVNSSVPKIASGEVSGHAQPPPPPSPSPAPGPAPPPAPSSSAVYSTLLLVYEWPTSSTPSGNVESFLAAKDANEQAAESPFSTLLTSYVSGSLSKDAFVHASAALAATSSAMLRDMLRVYKDLDAETLALCVHGWHTQA